MFRFTAAILLIFTAFGFCGFRRAHAAEPGQKLELLVDAGQSLFILNDRPAKVKEFFQQHRIVVGGAPLKELIALSQAAEPREGVFLHYTSANDNPEKAGQYGDILNLAPLHPEVAAFFNKQVGLKGKDGDRSITVILRRDAMQEKLHHVVGLTTLSPVSFFEQKENLRGNDFSPADLQYQQDCP